MPRTPADHHDGARRQRKLTAARVLLTAVLLGGAACGGRTTEPPSPTPAPTPQPPDAPSGSTVSGNERIGWNQELVPETSANDYRFDVYVDADRTALGGVTCTPRANGLQAECSAPLPAMPAGRHDLRLVAIRQVGGAAHESLRSAPLPVVNDTGQRPDAALPGTSYREILADPNYRRLWLAQLSSTSIPK